MSKKTNRKVPLYSKVGWGITWAILLVLLFMLGRNLLGSIIYGPTTAKKDISTFYDAGFSDALSGKKREEIKLIEKNPLLRQSYTKGFKDGRDRVWHKEGN